MLPLQPLRPAEPALRRAGPTALAVLLLLCIVLCLLSPVAQSDPSLAYTRGVTVLPPAAHLPGRRVRWHGPRIQPTAALESGDWPRPFAVSDEPHRPPSILVPSLRLLLGWMAVVAAVTVATAAVLQLGARQFGGPVAGADSAVMQFHMLSVEGAAALPAGREELKRLLLRQAAASPAVPRAALVATVEALEAANPTPNPADSPLVSGTWALLFAGAPTAQAEAERARREGVVGSAISPRLAKDGSIESTGSGPLGRSLANLRSGLARTRGTWQDIDAANGRVRNRADFDLLWGLIKLAFCIDGRCFRVAPEATGGQARRLAVTFDSVTLALGRGGPEGTIPPRGLTLSLRRLNKGQGPQGWVDTTYLDDDVRLGRGDKGTVFVTARLRADR